MLRSTSTSTWAVANATSSGTITEYIERYLFELQVEGLSPASLRLYRFVLASFAEFVGESSPVDILEHDLIRAFFFDVYEHGYKPASLASFNVVVRIVCKWLMMERVLEYDPAARIPAAKRPQATPYYLSDSKVERLLACCGSNRTGIRTRTIVLTLLGTGMRVSELAGLTMDSVDMEGRCITVLGKGNKNRPIPSWIHWLGSSRSGSDSGRRWCTARTSTPSSSRS